LPLGVLGLLRRLGQLLAQIGQLLDVLVALVEQLEGLLQAVLGGALLGGGQLAIGQAVQILLHLLGIRRPGILSDGGKGEQAAAEGGGAKQSGQAVHAAGVGQWKGARLKPGCLGCKAAPLKPRTLFIHR